MNFQPITSQMRRAALASLAVVSSLAAPPRAGAQDAPERPKLAASADTNSWEAYYDRGVEDLKFHRATGADAAFYWASQLAPQRAEPLFGRWVAFWLSDYGRWEDYLNERPSVLASPAVARANALPDSAMMRNPFVHQGLAILLYDQMPGRWPENDLTRGWIAYSGVHSKLALDHLGRALRHEKKRRVWIRTMRAQSFVNLAQYDSAAAELEALRAEMVAREQSTVGTGYQSKEMIAYAVAMLRIASGDKTGGRAALGDALSENLGFYPAHDLLGQLAVAEGDTATALRESEQAVQIAPDDAVMQYRHGVALLAALRPADAVAPLKRATASAPWYAAPHYSLGIALEDAGQADAARAALERYVAIAPRGDSTYVAAARKEISRLGGGGAGR